MRDNFCSVMLRDPTRTAGTYEDMRTGPHHIFMIEGEKTGFTRSSCQHSLKFKFRKSLSENTLKKLEILHKSKLGT